MWAGPVVATLCEMTSSGSEQPSLKSHPRRRAVALALAVACLAPALLASGSSAELSGASTPVKIGVKANPKRLAVDPRTGQVEYRFRATNTDTEASGTVRLCARKWPHGRLRLRGERCEAFASLDPGESAVRVFKFKIRARARGKLSKVRLRARGSNAAAAVRTVWLRVRRRAGPSKTVKAPRHRFRPRDVTVRRGERLVWRNGAVTHTVTFCSALFQIRCDPEAGYRGSPFGWGEFNELFGRRDGSIARTAMRRGTFQYYCAFHAGMKGTITVR